MKNRKDTSVERRILALLLSFALLLSIVPASVFAESWSPYPESGQDGLATDGKYLTLRMRDSTALLKKNIQTDGDVEEYYHNKLTTTLDPSTELVFSFAFQGTGYNEKHLPGIQQNTYPKIKIYQAENKEEVAEETCIASQEKGNLSFTEVYKPVEWMIDLKMEADTLGEDTDYALVFDESIYGNQENVKLKKAVIFFFSTGKSGSGNTGSSGDESQEPSYNYQGAGKNQIKLTSPSDVTVLSEDGKLFSKQWYKNKINTPVTAENGRIFFGYQQTTGQNNFSESQFEDYKSDLGIYDETGKDKLADIEFDRFENRTIYITADVSKLNPETYILRFGPNVRGNNADKILDSYVDFFFELDKEKIVVSVTGVRVAPAKMSLIAGHTGRLAASVSPSDATNKGVVWNSSNANVAKVDANGMVTAMRPGSAAITVKTKDGGYTAKSIVTVSAASVKATGVKVTPKSVTLTAGKAKKLKATVMPQAATNQSVSWASSNKKVAKVNGNGRVTAVSPGTAVITVRTKDGGFRAKTTVKVRPKTATFTLTRPSAGAVKVKYRKIKNASGYVIYRSNSKNGKFKKVTTRKAKKSRTYINRGLKKKKAYWYKMRTYQVVKGKRIYSTFSKAKKIKTR